MVREFQDDFFPKNCLNCRAEGAWLCEKCFDGLILTDSRFCFCPFCENRGDLFRVCKNCRDRTGVERVFSLLQYGDPLARKIIKNFKYHYVKDIAGDLEPLFRKFFVKYKNLLDLKDAILIPVPLHWYKECDRGFNQAEELAKVMGKILDLPVKNDLVVKKWTKSQAKLERTERHSNLQNCFAVKKSPSYFARPSHKATERHGKASQDRPKNIIIVDDVFTTGSTVRELSSVLHSAGAEKIQVITLARG